MASQHSILDDLLADVPEDVDVFVQLIGDLAQQVKNDMAAQGLTRRALAQRLGKSESEITKWLSGMHNLTLQSVAKLSTALQLDLLVTRDQPLGHFGQQATTAVEASARRGVQGAASTVSPPPPPQPARPALTISSTPFLAPGPRLAGDEDNHGYPLAA